MKDLELILLNMWKSNDFEVIYKYKNRIKAFREPLVNIELFYDPTYGMFQDVEDIANYEDSTPEDFKRNINDLIQIRSGLSKVYGGNLNTAIPIIFDFYEPNENYNKMVFGKIGQGMCYNKKK